MDRISFASRLVVAAVLLQTLVAPALFLELRTPRWIETIICSAHGLKLVQREEAPAQTDGTAGVREFCPACGALAGMPPIAAPVPPPAAWAEIADTSVPAPAPRLVGRARAPPFDPRGPPFAPV